MESTYQDGNQNRRGTGFSPVGGGAPGNQVRGGFSPYQGPYQGYNPQGEVSPYQGYNPQGLMSGGQDHFDPVRFVHALEQQNHYLKEVYGTYVNLARSHNPNYSACLHSVVSIVDDILQTLQSLTQNGYSVILHYPDRGVIGSIAREMERIMISFRQSGADVTAMGSCIELLRVLIANVECSLPDQRPPVPNYPANVNVNITFLEPQHRFDSPGLIRALQGFRASIPVGGPNLHQYGTMCFTASNIFATYSGYDGEKELASTSRLIDGEANLGARGVARYFKRHCPNNNDNLTPGSEGLLDKACSALCALRFFFEPVSTATTSKQIVNSVFGGSIRGDREHYMAVASAFNSAVGLDPRQLREGAYRLLWNFATNFGADKGESDTMDSKLCIIMICEVYTKSQIPERDTGLIK